MTTLLPGFDESLNRALEECAREAGEDVDTYVVRAVASQMLADLMRAENPLAKDLLNRFSVSGVFTSSGMPNVTAVVNDPDRLNALYATGLLDSPPEQIYDRITRAAADALDAPYSAVSLVDVDRQFFKSTAGMDIGGGERQTPLDQSVCQYAVANGSPLVLEDARNDPIFKNHPVVRSGAVVAYLGIPLMDHTGHAIGTLCVFDNKPRLWSTGHVQVLGDLAALAAERIFGSASGRAS
ncbi:GAF domain-containing protein [Mycolicibacterium chubuense NBB4]|uniref:GAF domain-containing protein n=1 Tax=Mycolicibacterium chubuense (strain NBB4) TaxID=710421 RepID=I4BFR1_MYCCN|nr:GAF domain-containing protein [Mycolicibacterium chubuense]AFM16118.1 GAF domain-containing protein [Mycolicibacterium chubuense NBB4]